MKVVLKLRADGAGMPIFAPIREALRLINEETFENADILFITDGQCSISDGLAEQLQGAIQDARCSVVGLLKGNCTHSPCDECISPSFPH